MRTDALIGERSIVGWILDDLEARLSTWCGENFSSASKSHLSSVLHQLTSIVEFVNRIRWETKRFREQTDEAIAESLHVRKVSLHGISESLYKPFIGPLGIGPLSRQLGS